VLETAQLHGREDVGALRIRTVATKDRPCNDFPYKNGKEYDPAVILDLDYWVLMPR
jgi:2-methylfumaryl-CoA hydratase